jgi:hypothetical protein
MLKLRRLLVTGLVILAGACLVSCRANDKVQAADNPPSQGFWQRLTRAPERITIPAGTTLEVRLSDALSSRDNRSGDTFAATLAEPLVVGNQVAVPRGAMVTGQVVEAQASGHLKTPAELGVTLTSLETGGKDYDLSTSTDLRYARSHKKHDAAWIGGAAVGGALLGALAGGGKGAAIGAGVGAGGGTAGAYATGRKDIVLGPETRLSFKLSQPLVIPKPR